MPILPVILGILFAVNTQIVIAGGNNIVKCVPKPEGLRPAIEVVLESVVAVEVTVVSTAETKREKDAGTIDVIATKNSSGFIFRSKENYVITNMHVLTDPSDYPDATGLGTIYAAVLSDCRRVSIDFLFTYSDIPNEADLAVFRIRGDVQGVTKTNFAHPNDIINGQDVYVLGAPGAVTNQVSSGHITRMYSNVHGYATPLHFTTAPIRSGNSGGPVVDYGGKVVGITQLGLIDSKGNFTGGGYLIPLKYLLEVVTIIEYIEQ